MLVVFKILLLFLSMCVCICEHAVCVGASKGRKRALGPLAVKLQVAVSCLMYVLGTELGSSG